MSFLTASNNKIRLLWSRTEQSWIQQEWRCVLFSDELRFPTRIVFAESSSGKNEKLTNKLSYVKEIDRFDRQGILVCYGLLLDNRTSLHVFNGDAVTAHHYTEKGLEAHARLFRGLLLIFMDGNMKPYRAQIVDDFLDKNIRRKNRPSRSPNRNPIEHVWDCLERAIEQLNVLPNTLQELKAALLEEWASLS
ncbi:uncharacterized protein LOC129980623 [Argiope bruennichi]|uniref:uncharacterized protein LOC129980623 n=1 Tax=Argiope bruennichi TaxID=94029 RepID=UPI0024957C27|nr:uncharacterized protein LOC129980623 [Argiope bruennichi]